MRIPAFLLFTLAAFATAPQPKPTTTPRPVRELHHLTEGRLPHLQLREMALGSTLDSIVRGSSPSASGQVLCSTSSTTAVFESVSSCFGTSLSLNASGSTTTSPASLSWANWAANEAIRISFGDNGTALQVGFGDRMQMYSYNDIDIVAGRATTTALAFATGNAGAGNINLAAGATGQVVVNSPLVVGSSGSQISWSGRCSLSTGLPAVNANTCTNSSVTCTGAAIGADCSVSSHSAAGLTENVSLSCGVSGANTVVFHVCNPTTGNLSALAGTWTARVSNP